MKTPITVSEAAYLKHSGNLLDVKVTIKIIDGYPIICIQDEEHKTFSAAAHHLRQICKTIRPVTYETMIPLGGYRP